jgi:hypothetical protein
MANKFARSNGDFNNASIWSLSATGLSATTVPTIGDNASSNNFVVQITGTVTCDNITNGTRYGGFNQGSVGFGMNNNSTLNANIFGPSGSSPNQCVAVSGTNCTIVGNIQGGNNNSARGCLVTGSVTVYGNVAAGGNTGSIGLVNSGTTNIYGNVNSGGINAGISNTSTGSVTVYGNLEAGSGEGITSSSTGSISIYGNLNGATASALSNTSTGSVTVLGNVTGDSRGGAGITSTNAAANVRISGNLIGAPNGIPAVYAASYTVNPVPYQTYIRYANNGTGVGSDAYLYHYTTDSLSAFSMPPVSAVRAGLQYADNTLTGTCEIPAVSAVTFGALVDNTSGTAVLTNNTLFDVSVASLTATDSLGARLKNSATVESVGRIIASF